MKRNDSIMFSKLLHRIKKGMSFINNYDVIKSLYWRFKLHLPRSASFHIGPKSIVEIGSRVKFSLRQGELSINESWFRTRHRRYVSEFRLENEAVFICNGDFKLYQGASIYVAPYAKLILNGGGSFLNTDSTINCFHYIEIGKGCAISDNVCISDSDSHSINGQKTEMVAPVIIGNHVWIGKNVTILKGVHIDDGAIIGAGSIVVKDIPAKCLAVGNPARVIKENIEWR